MTLLGLSLNLIPMLKNALESEAAIAELREQYLDLLMKCLTMLLWEAKDGAHMQPFGNDWLSKLKRLYRRVRFGEVPKTLDSRTQRLEGRDWPVLAHTMIGVKRLANVKFCVEDVVRKGVPGDLIETGVWRGGTTIFMRAILKAYGVEDRRVWVADSFEGLPPPDTVRYPPDADSILHELRPLAISLDEVRANFGKYGLLDDRVCFLKGWFKETLPAAPIERLAVARLDGDMYESTMDGLTNLYPKLSVGGYLIVDDYGAVPACRQAVEDYRKAQGIDEPIQKIDWEGVYWQRRNKGS